VWLNRNSIIDTVNNPSPARTGNRFNLKGDIKTLFTLGFLKRSHITEKLTNANTMKIPNTERLATSTERSAT
jgi:hypothetical protein